MARTAASSDALPVIIRLWLSACREREVELEGRADADLAFDVDAPLVPVDDLAHDGKTQARAARFRREEGREYLIKNIGRNAASRVADIELHPAGLRNPRANRDLAPLRRRHHLDAVADQVADRLLH